jgi:hypothetical protein
MLTVKEVTAKVARLQTKYAARDGRMRDVLSVRQGDISKVYPSMFSDEYPKPLVANIIDVAARDLAESMAPLPSFNCSAANTVSDTARKAADLRGRIANYYVDRSELGVQMYTGADWYNTYGMLIGRVELDYEESNPIIKLINPFGTYPEIDRFGRCLSLTQIVGMDAQTLASMYPEFYNEIVGKNQYTPGSPYLSLVRYHDKDQDLIYLPERNGLVLSNTPNPIGECMARVAMRPSIDGEARGQYDDVLGVQLARARMAVLQIQAAEKSIQAPIAIPQDVQELALGPDSIMRSANPQGIRRVPLELPQGVFGESSVLERELRTGARYPETRGGNSDASIVTGRGVQALQAGFDTQIKAAQSHFARMFVELIGLCFKTDEKIFGNQVKEIRGVDDGTPYTIKYTPAKAIAGDYTVDVRYGIMSGMNPNNATVALLQMRSDKLVSRDYVRRELPIEINVGQEEQKVDIEEMRDALRAAISQTALAIPQMVAQGQDPMKIITSFAEMIKNRQKGMSIETVVEKAFMPEPQPETAAMQPQPPVAGMAPVPASQPSMEQPGGAAPAAGGPQAPQAPQGKPDIASLLASIGGAA